MAEDTGAATDGGGEGAAAADPGKGGAAAKDDRQGSLLDMDVTAGAASTGDGGADGADADAVGEGGAAEPVKLKIGDAEVEVPQSVADHVKTLEGELEGFKSPQVPEGDYALNVPEELAKQAVEADPKDPMFKVAQEWAKANNVAQEKFDELVQAYYQHKLEDHQAETEARETERQAMIGMFNEGGKLSEGEAIKKANEIGNWAVSILGPTLVKEPQLADELKFLTATSSGIRLLQVMRQRTGDSKTPVNRDAGTSPASDPVKAMYPTMKQS